VRTDVPRLDEVILPSLRSGELRQGWGYRADQDLNVVGTLVYESGRSALNDAQKATWNRVQRFWPGHWDPVHEDDLILLPKVPGPRRWSLVKVTGTYRYEIHPTSGDHGHILPVETLVPEIAPSNLNVQSGLVRTMRCERPMWSISHLSDEVDALLAAGGDLAVPDSETVRLQAVLDDTLEDLLRRIRQDFRATQLEGPVHRLLGHVFDEAEVEDRTGSGEHGADFLVSTTDGFGHEYTTVVQLKDHDPLNDRRALEQVREAFEHYSPSAAVILTTASREEESFAQERMKLGEELGIPVTSMLGRELARWFLAHLEDLAAD
jgi:hypothetical protein